MAIVAVRLTHRSARRLSPVHSASAVRHRRRAARAGQAAGRLRRGQKSGLGERAGLIPCAVPSSPLPSSWWPVRQVLSASHALTRSSYRPRRLLLSAALRVLRPPPPFRQAPALQHRCLGGGGRGGRADRCPDPVPLAAGAHPASGRLGLRPRGLNGLVREEPG